MNIADTINQLWSSNNSFNPKLSSWLEDICRTQEATKALREKFHQWNPLMAYVSSSSSKSGGISLRFLGQEIASLKMRKDGLKLVITEAQCTNKSFKANFKDFIFLPAVLMFH